MGNMYPPHYLGGYELIWRSSVAQLRDAGHDVRVLTTDFSLDGAAADTEPDVHRELRWYWHDHGYPWLPPRERLRIERHNAEALERHLDGLRPDVVAWWAMGGMSLGMIERVRRRGMAAVGVVADHWMGYGFHADAWTRTFVRGYARPLARAVEVLARRPTHVDLGASARWLFISEEVRRHALGSHRLGSSAVVHPGVDTNLFRPADASPWSWRLLYAGRVEPRKGVRLAVEALAELPDEATLTIDGPGEPDEVEHLRTLIAGLGLTRRVRLQRSRRSELGAVYAAADAVLFPVLWNEPWGLVPLEGMAVGRPVVTSGRGGQREYLKPEDNCLVFEPSSGARGLAAEVARLAADDDLRGRLREGGLATAARLTDDEFNRTVAAELEAAAQRAARSSA